MTSPDALSKDVLDAMRAWIASSVPPANAADWTPHEVVIFVDFWHPGGVSASIREHALATERGRTA